MTLSRRDFLSASAAAGVGAITSFGSWGNRANAATSLVAADWGGDDIKAIKAVEAKQSDVTINWTLFQGGAGSILPKVKASWPNPQFDVLAGWEGSFYSMVAEDWLETVTVADIPNLADMPEKIIVKDKQGNWKAVPRAIGGIYFGYRKDISPIEVTSIDDFFSPKLKGKVNWPGPSENMLLQIVALAIHAGGNEHNMEPGWKLMADLAKTGNIGRVSDTDSDFSNSLSSGETAVGFYAEPGWAVTAKNFPVVHLTHQAGMPTFLYQSGFAILKNRPNTAATKQWVNFAISPEMDQLYSEISGEAPLNAKSKTPEQLKHLHFTSDDMEKYVYVPDFTEVLTKQDEWNKRWEKDIAPLLSL